MNRSSVLVGAVAVIVGTHAALAQVAAGPLADPAAAQSAAKPAAVPAAKTGRKPAHAAVHKHIKKAAASSGNAAEAPAAAPDERNLPVSSADRRTNGSASDPISFGMKWNGANDNGEKTRVQNYEGNAEGTGAEVGLKLHF